MRFACPKKVLFLCYSLLLLSACQASVEAADKTKEAKPVTDSHSIDADKPKTETPVVVTGSLEGENCSAVSDSEGKLLQGDCVEGLVCVPQLFGKGSGTCRTSCGEESNDKLVKNNSLCGGGLTCQVLISAAKQEQLGAFCMPQQTKRDADCFGLGDEQSCARGMACAIGQTEEGPTGNLEIASFKCRETCRLGHENTCARANETCMPAKYGQTVQQKSDGTPMFCKLENCGADSSKCECDLAEDFTCEPHPTGMFSLCTRQEGWCGLPVPFVQETELSEVGFSGQTCNEVNASKFCDNSAFKSLGKQAGQSICIEMDKRSHEGICFAFCSTPDLDRDGDGVISDEEKGAQLKCPSGYSCSVNLGRSLGLVVSIANASSLDGMKACDPKKCTANAPCPSECGPGSAECLSYKAEAGVKSFCGAPYGSCQLDVTPVPDGSTTEGN